MLAQNPKGDIPPDIATAGRHEETVRVLVAESGANMLSQTPNGHASQQWVAGCRQVELLRVWLQNETNVRRQLLLAALDRHVEIMGFRWIPKL
jgi:hypothetical protein